MRGERETVPLGAIGRGVQPGFSSVELFDEAVQPESNKIRALLADRGMTQENFSRRVRVVTKRHLERIEAGENVPTLTTAMAIATVLGVPLEKVFNIKIKTRDAL